MTGDKHIREMEGVLTKADISGMLIVKRLRLGEGVVVPPPFDRSPSAHLQVSRF